MTTTQLIILIAAIAVVLLIAFVAFRFKRRQGSVMATSSRFGKK